MRAGLTIGNRPLDHHRKEGDLSFLSSLAGHQQYLLARLGRLTSGQGKGLADPQTAAIEQQENRGVALDHPGAFFQQADAVESRGRVLNSERLRHAMGPLRGPNKIERGVLEVLSPRSPAMKAAHSGQGSSAGTRTQTVSRTPGEPGPVVSQAQTA